MAKLSIRALALAGVLAAGHALAAGAPGADWAMAGGDPGNLRYSPLGQITPKSIDRLGGAWTAPLGGMSRATPIVQDGVMYVPAIPDVLNAIDAATGRVIWSRKVEGGFAGANRGLALGAGKIFIGSGDGRLLAFDARTGAPAWTALIADSRGAFAQAATAAPAFANGLVITGLIAGDAGIRGRVVALDADTGREVWRFHTTPAPGEVGHDSWPKDSEAWKRGGAAVWATPAVDSELGLVVFGTSNAWPTFGPEVRPGDNLFAASIVAVDLATGQYRWHYQLIHHDMWEGDVGAPPVFYDATVDGKRVKAVAALRADGHLFLLDRATGKPIFPVTEKPVAQNPRLKTAATQPMPVGADQIGPDCVEPALLPAGFKAGCYWEPVDFTNPNIIYPSNARFAPMAYSPANGGRFFIGGSSAGYWLRRGEDPFFFVVPVPPPGLKSYGLLTAIDARTNRIVWQQKRPWGLAMGTGMLATAGGLVFHGEPDGTVHATDAGSGKPVWQFQTGAPVLGPLATYEAGGVQYVAAVSGASVWAFKLGGTVPPQAAPPAPPTQTDFAGRIVATDKVLLMSEVAGAVGNVTAKDEYTLKPSRIRVAAGTTVTWTNNGAEPHELAALDGSWTTGPIAPGATATHTFTEPGKVTYICTAHPWTYAQVVVEPK
jgi:alcohol dehydrogenase (cytochrome c)